MTKETQTTKNKSQEEKKKMCGIIMPIASTSGYKDDHWKDVYNILCEAIKETGFEARLVSDDEAIGLIHDRIVTNIYEDEIIICDVSSKNPNVMFELGMRLAFDKPTIIIKDEKTGYSFDTGVIEHIQYPSSLRFGDIVTFKEELGNRIRATYDKSQNDKKYSPFLKSFGKTIVPATLEGTEISEGKFILEKLDQMNSEIRILKNTKDKFYEELGTTLRSSLRKDRFFNSNVTTRWLTNAALSENTNDENIFPWEKDQ